MSRLHPAQSDAELSSDGDNGGDNPWTSKVQAAVSSIQPVQDFTRLATVPCARKSLLFGMVTAAGVTGISFVAGRGMRHALNWGVGSFCFISIASWESCRRTYKAEQNRMKTVIDGYKRNSRAHKPSLTTLAEQEQQQPSQPA